LLYNKKTNEIGKLITKMSDLDTIRGSVNLEGFIRHVTGWRNDILSLKNIIIDTIIIIIIIIIFFKKKKKTQNQTSTNLFT
jgi:hypothetical protein